MPITVKHAPSAAATGSLAYLIGRGKKSAEAAARTQAQANQDQQFALQEERMRMAEEQAIAGREQQLLMQDRRFGQQEEMFDRGLEREGQRRVELREDEEYRYTKGQEREIDKINDAKAEVKLNRDGRLSQKQQVQMLDQLDAKRYGIKEGPQRKKEVEKWPTGKVTGETWVNLETGDDMVCDDKGNSKIAKEGMVYVGLDGKKMILRNFTKQDYVRIRKAIYEENTTVSVDSNNNTQTKYPTSAEMVVFMDAELSRFEYIPPVPEDPSASPMGEVKLPQRGEGATAHPGGGTSLPPITITDLQAKILEAQPDATPKEIEQTTANVEKLIDLMQEADDTGDLKAFERLKKFMALTISGNRGQKSTRKSNNQDRSLAPGTVSLARELWRVQ